MEFEPGDLFLDVGEGGYTALNIVPYEPPQNLVVHGPDQEVLLDMNLRTGEVFVANEDRMPEAARIFWDNVRILMGR